MTARHPSADSGYTSGMDQMMTSTTTTGQELFFQLQQLQHQQQMHQQGMIAAAAAAAAYGYPNPNLPTLASGYPGQPYAMTNSALQRTPSSMACVANSTTPLVTLDQQQTPTLSMAGPVDSNPPANISDDTNLMQRMEKKDQMISQLGSFLAQMQQESEVTSSEWKGKIQELNELKTQLTAVTQQLTETQEKERENATQAAQYRQDLEIALETLQKNYTTHLEELGIMNEEIKKRQSEMDHMKNGYEQSLKEISQQLLDAQQNHQDALTQCHALQASIAKVEEGHQLVLNQCDEDKQALNNSLQELSTQLQIREKEKQELGQHLWHVTQELEQTKRREVELEQGTADTIKELEQARATWTERFQQLQNDKAKLFGEHSMLQSQLQELDAKFQTEKSQKEELNVLMVREMQRFNEEMESFHRNQETAFEQMQDEKEQWRLQKLELQDRLALAEEKAAQSNATVENLQLVLQQIGEENQHLHQNGSEKLTTLQELNQKLRDTMEELEHTHNQFLQLQTQWERVQTGFHKCSQLLPPSVQDSNDDTLDRIIKSLEDFAQLSSSNDQMKISMLRLQQDQDMNREKFRHREQELEKECQDLRQELETVRNDAKTLAQEIQQLTRLSGGNEAKLSAQLQQLTKELDEMRNSSGMQVLQLQKSLESQRNRTLQLENEKKELLQDAEQLNTTMEELYQANNEKQVQLDQLRTTWKELQLEHTDLKEVYEDLQTTSHHTLEELNERLKHVQTELQQVGSQKEAMESELRTQTDKLAIVQTDYEAMSRQVLLDRSKWTEKEQELNNLLEDKTRRMEEMIEMLTQLRDKTESLEKSRVNEDQLTRQEFDKIQQQLLALSQEKKRFEIGYCNIKTQHEQAMQELYMLKEEKRQYLQQQTDQEEELNALKNEHDRVKSEMERVSRAKSGLQMELHRVTDEAQDVLRQFEVLRRDVRIQEKKFQDELEKMRKEMEDARNDGAEANALVEELQTKMTSVQTAANATINDLMNELQNAQETISFEKSRLQKENETLKVQLHTLDDEFRRKELEVKDLQASFRQEKNRLDEKDNEWMMKCSRLTNTLDARKQEIEKLSKELETKGLKMAEYERKLTPLMNAKESLQTKNTELKHALEQKTREFREMDERYREDLTKVVKEKRDLEASYLTIKEDYEMIKSQTSNHHQQWTSESKTLKQSLERTKNELIKANAEVLSLTQRLDNCQNAANETIAELTARLHGAEQQKEITLNGLQREIHLERERRREAEVQKMEIQRLLRQQRSAPASTSLASTNNSSIEETSENWISVSTPATPAFSCDSDTSKAASAPSLSTSQVSTPIQHKHVHQSEFHKFYANEPMTNAELSNIPMALIKAQIGLDFAGKETSSPTKIVNNKKSLRNQQELRSSFETTHLENNEEIPLLALEKLPQNPEADGNDIFLSGHPENNSDRLTSDHHEKSSSSFLAALSSRHSDRYLVDVFESSKSRSSKTISSGNNNSSSRKAGGGSKKKNLSSSSSATAAAYNSPVYLPPKVVKIDTKSKSTSKLLPRIPQ